MGLNAVVIVAEGGVGLRPRRLRRDAPGRLRHRRARARHEPQRRPGVDVLPDLRRLQRRHASSEADDKDLALVMLQAYNDWHIDEWCAAYPGRFIPLAIPPDLGPATRWSTRSGASRPRAVAAITMPELPHIQGLPSYHDLDYWDPFFQAVSRGAGRDVPAHRSGLRRHHHRRPTRRSTTSSSSPPRCRRSPRRTCCGARRSATTPTSRSRGPRPASGGSPSTSTAATATT